MRWLLRLMATFMLLAILLVAGFFLIPAEQIARVASERFQLATGRALLITGDVRPSLYPIVGARIDGIEVANADWASDAPMLRAETLDVGLDLAALWRGIIAIRRIELHAPEVLLERDAQGRGNWELARPAAPSAPAATQERPRTTRPLTLDEGSIFGGRVTFVDHATGNRYEVSDLDLAVALPLASGPADVDLTARLQGQSLAFRARVADAAALVSGDVSAVELTASYAGASLIFAGRGGTAPFMAEGRLTAEVTDAARVVNVIGGGTLPSALHGPARLAGDLSLTAEGSGHLRNGSLRMGGNDFTFAGDLSQGDARPHLVAQIATETLRVNSPDAQSRGGESVAAPQPAGWSRETLDASALHLIDADVTFAADAVESAGLSLGRTRFGMALSAGRAVFDLKEVEAFDGTITGEFVVNARGGLSVGGNLQGADVGMQPLLVQIAGYDRLIAKADARLRFLGVGNSVDAIMKSFSGEGSIAMGRGELQGLDLLGMLRRLDPSHVGEGARTIFDSITGSFTIEEGILRNDDLAFEAPLLRAQGQGSVGLGQRDLNYRLVPTALSAEDGSGGVRVPILITGPWSGPKIQLDLQSIANERLDQERRDLEARAAAEAERALERLGVERAEGERLEDAARRALEAEARRRIEEEVGRGLGNLFGRN